MALPARGAHHQVALLEFRVQRTLDPADGTTGHHIAERHGRCIGRCIAHASAHVGIERQVEGFEQHLTFAQLRERHPLQAKVLRYRRPRGPRHQDDTLVEGQCVWHVSISLTMSSVV
ncbi:hypothetical protein D3C76_1383380 [compost metagenome]